VSAPFWGNDPADIWDDGYKAALNGRPIEVNPFRNGEAEQAAHPIDPDALRADEVDPTLGHEGNDGPQLS
jgi:hypothetical protein